MRHNWSKNASRGTQTNIEQNQPKEEWSVVREPVVRFGRNYCQIVENYAAILTCLYAPSFEKKRPQEVPNQYGAKSIKSKMRVLEWNWWFTSSQEMPESVFNWVQLLQLNTQGREPKLADRVLIQLEQMQSRGQGP